MALIRHPLVAAYEDNYYYAAVTPKGNTFKAVDSADASPKLESHDVAETGLVESDIRPGTDMLDKNTRAIIKALQRVSDEIVAALEVS